MRAGGLACRAERRPLRSAEIASSRCPFCVSRGGRRIGRQGLASVSVSVRHDSGGNPAPENTQAADRGRNAKIKTVGVAAVRLSWGPAPFRGRGRAGNRESGGSVSVDGGGSACSNIHLSYWAGGSVWGGWRGARCPLEGLPGQLAGPVGAVTSE